MSATVFTSLRVYPTLPSMTLIEFDIHPQFQLVDPYTFTVQFARDPAEDGDWTDIEEVTSISPGLLTVSVGDLVMRGWSPEEQWFYRVVLVNGDSRTYTSCAEIASGSLDRNDRLMAREIFRQERLRLVKRAGSKGLLCRLKHWGVKAEAGLVVSQNTGEVVDAMDASDFGTGFVGGYWTPIDYYIELRPGGKGGMKQEPSGTVADTAVSGRSLAWPIPRSRDFWYDCTSGSRYLIDEIEILAQARHIPVVLGLSMNLVPPTDPIYEVPLE